MPLRSRSGGFPVKTRYPAPGSMGRPFLFFVSLLVASHSLVLAATAPEKRTATATRVQDYLLQLDYTVATCVKDKPNRMLLDAELNSKKRRFLLDTGWSISSLDPSKAQGLKPLTEVPALT